MKCTLNAGDLAAALRGPCERAKPHNVIAILKHVRCEAKDSRLILLGHDLDSSSEAFVDADVLAPGACAIPSEPLARLIAGLPKAAHVSIEVIGSDAIVKSGRSRYKLPILDAADFPPALSAGDGAVISVSASDLKQIFVRPRPAISLKDPRPICHGFYLHNDSGKLSSVATTGYVLMRFATEIDATEFKGVMVSRTATDEIIKIGAGDLVISDRIISIISGSRTYSAKLIEAAFPENYQRMIPETKGACAKVDRDALIESLSRLRAISDFNESDLVDVTVEAGEISISMVGASDGSETIECDSEQSAFVCLRSGQLVDALKAMGGNHVEFHISNERLPCRIVDPSEPSAVNVIMPCASSTVRKAQAA